MMNETMMMNGEMNLDELEAVAGGGKVRKKFVSAAAPYGIAACAAAVGGIASAATGFGLICGGLLYGAYVFRES